MADINLELLPQTKRFRGLSLALIFILSVASCIYPLHAIKERDIVYFFLYNNLLSLYLQTFILLIIFGQILKVRPIAVFLGIRQAETGLVKKLLQLILLDILVMTVGLALPYLLSVRHYFRWGSPALGSLLLFLHLLCFALCAFFMILSLRVSHPWLIFIIAIAVIMLYHYNLEQSTLLSKYSILFDPLYRAIHRVYF
ncbi:hypothetical protein [Lactobacillus delbrueckii]|uniref:hypothetical protein n=1 Tax=Lactobacillus delbrueckii TaxID=1584 RepID=UPI0022E17ABE|nr:hypothetical protein [Lactobacillus delbrueckii]